MDSHRYVPGLPRTLSTPREAPDSRRTWTERRLKEAAVVLLRFPLALDVFLILVGARSLPVPELC